MAGAKDSHKQLERFKKAARDLGADESGDALDKAMDRIDPRQFDKDDRKEGKQKPGKK